MHRFLRLTARNFLIAMGIALGSSEAIAQGVTGSAVTGTVKDPSGQPLEGAEVKLVNTSTGQSFSAVTDSSGKYFIDNVPAGGPFTITGSYQGAFKPASRDGIQLTLGARQNVDLDMHFEGEMVQIVGHSDPLEDAARTGSSTRLSTQVIDKLPLQGRNFTDLLANSPKVTGNSFSGQNNRYNNIQIDGGNNQDLFGLAGNGTPGGQANAKALSVEAIQDFVIQVAPFDVRLGNFAGGLVNAITKSGTNEFHGSVFGYYQNKALTGWYNNASVVRSLIVPLVGPQKTTEGDDPTYNGYSVGQFGATVGGPIIKDKLHFFIATDIQQRSSAFGSPNQLTGDSARDISNVGFDRGVAERFATILNKYGINNAGNSLATSLGNPDKNLFVKLTSSLINNSNLELSYNLVTASADVLSRNPFGVRLPSVDAKTGAVTGAGNLTGGYELSNSGYAQANTTNTIRGKLTTNWDGGKLSNEFLGGVSIIRDNRQIPNNTPLILVAAGNVAGTPTYLSAGGERFSQANSLDQNIYQLQDNVTFGLGRSHRVTVGTSNQFFNFKNVFFQASTGVYVFGSMDDFDAGNVQAYQRRFGVSPLQDPGTAKLSVAQLGGYVQDEWQITDNLLITPGVRIDVPLLSKGVQNPALLNNAPFALDTSRVPSGNPLWSPRIGFNLKLDSEANTVIRGGAGIFSGPPPYVWIANAYSVNGLSQVQLTCFGKAGVPTFSTDPNAQPSDCSGGTGKPTPPANQGEIDYFDPNTKYPQNGRLALGVDRRLPLDIVATADFLYTQDINGWYVTDENLVPQGVNGEGRQTYGTLGADAKGNFSASPTRVDPNTLQQAVRVENKNGGKVYSATLQLQKNFAQQYNLSIAYTYSKSLDLMSLTSSQAFSNFQFAPLDGSIADRNLRPSAFDRPHKITITGTVALPYGFGAGLSYVGQSGTPYTWTVSGDVNGDGVSGNDLPFIPSDPSQITLKEATGDAPGTAYQKLSNFVDSQSCLKDARGSFLQRSACRNPWQNFLNTRFTWTSPELHSQRFEAQLDIFNLANLIKPSWALYQEVTGFENVNQQFLRAVGYDTANNRPVYAFAQPQINTTTVYSPTQSRWRIQLGGRYLF